ncbi:MAG: hypothetical protein BGN97_03870 [Microbacterium sp. 69-10]|uniref:hypothetical protein n=1 Tax=Microbacterium sp. 69-10 TaxID=1895783 RepID=UPI000965F1D0|nr:hypothetical protein [Microbacterium sp. 69-10]OJU41572.1 MAG: hypothetical protein BGN97_03870 [Microbacterium sp. 69-10]
MAETQPISAHLFALIDAYALACAEREASRDCAAWAFFDAHRAMLAARAAVASALSIPARELPPLTDNTTRLAMPLMPADGEHPGASSQAGLASLRGGLIAQQGAER